MRSQNKEVWANASKHFLNIFSVRAFSSMSRILVHLYVPACSDQPAKKGERGVVINSLKSPDFRFGFQALSSSMPSLVTLVPLGSRKSSDTHFSSWQFCLCHQQTPLCRTDILFLPSQPQQIPRNPFLFVRCSC